ncbi:MAG: TatD family hydrolase [Clostridiales bacterium]
MFFDTHAHYDSCDYESDRDELLLDINKSGVDIILNPSIDTKTSKTIIEMSKKYDFIYVGVGIHPHEATIDEQEFEVIRELINHDKVVAIGEIGLDYHYNFKDIETQKKCFKEQLKIAIEFGLPVIIHDREAHKDILDILKSDEFRGLKGVMHCYSGSIEMAKELLDLGYYLSFGGSITFKNAKKALEVIEYMPENKILIETDSPYLSPVPHRGKRNDSRKLEFIAEKIADIRKRDYNYICEITMKNGKKLFSI